MIDLSTTYLGLRLRSPIVPSASPLCEDLGNLRHMEDAGAGAVVLHSLFEEQIRRDRDELLAHLAHGAESNAEAVTYIPEPAEYAAGPDQYLKTIRQAVAALDIPVIASLNGSTLGNWTQYARLIEQAGASALELNIYWIPTSLTLPAADVEKIYLDIVRAVKREVTIPVAVKVSPFFTNFANMAAQFDKVGADALVLFNRFYQPDIDVEALEIRPNILLSTPMAMRLPLRWIALLHGRVKANLAATGGIHRAPDVIKMLMAGADVTMLCSVLLRRGIPFITLLEQDVIEWLESHDYESVSQIKGSLSQINCPDPAAFERAQYMSAITNSGY